MNDHPNKSSQKINEKNPLQIKMESVATSAARYLTEIMNATNNTVSHLRLEEIEQYTKDGKKLWRVTISFTDDGTSNTMQMLYGAHARVYKVITITDDLEMTSIKNRD